MQTPVVHMVVKEKLIAAGVPQSAVGCPLPSFRTFLAFSDEEVSSVGEVLGYAT